MWTWAHWARQWVYWAYQALSHILPSSVIASEIYQSVSRNCVDLNELPNDGENNDICREEIVVWNEYLIEDIGVIEENEDINSIENEFEPFFVNVFLVKKRLSFSIKIMQIDMILQFENVVLSKKMEKM